MKNNKERLRTEDEDERIQQRARQNDQRHRQPKSHRSVLSRWRRTQFNAEAADEYLQRMQHRRRRVEEESDWRKKEANRQRHFRHAARGAGYIQYPLALLHLFENRHEQLDAALHYGVMYRARNLYRSNGAETGKRKAVIQAQHDTWVTGGIEHHRDVWNKVRERLRTYGIKPDKTAFIRMSTRRAFDLRDLTGKAAGLNDNDVRVLQAITYKIGDKDFAPMSRPEIARAAAGAMNAAQSEAFEREKPDRLSESQVARSVGKLADEYQFVSRYIGRGRKGWLNYFSFTLQPGELQEAVEREWNEEHQQRKRRPLRYSKGERADEWEFELTPQGLK